MKVGMSLLEETSDGVNEIPSQQTQQTDEVQLAVPVSVEPSEAETNELNKVSNFPETNAVANIVDLKELKDSIEKSQGVNKDIALSMESIVPGILKEAGLHINGFTECLSKVNYDESLKIIDKKFGKKSFTYSEENLVFVIRYLVEEQEEKKKTRKEIAEDLIEQMDLEDHSDLERNFEIAFKDFKKDMDKLNEVKEDLDELVNDIKWEVSFMGAKIKILSFLKSYSKKYSEYESLAEKTSATIDICLGLFYLSKNEYFGHYFSTTFLGHSMDLNWIKRDFKLPTINKSEKPWREINNYFPETVVKFTFEKSKVLSTNFNDLCDSLKR